MIKRINIQSKSICSGQSKTNIKCCQINYPLIYSGDVRKILLPGKHLSII